MHHILYQRLATTEFDFSPLPTLVEPIRRLARRHGLTGVLLYQPQKGLLGILEGEQPAVTDLFYHRLSVDLWSIPWQVLSEGPWAHRSFPDWILGMQAPPTGGACPGEGVVDFHFLRTALSRWAPSRPALVHLLLEFMEPEEDAIPTGAYPTWY